MLLMLDHLLGEERVHTDVLDYLQCFYKLTTVNADVRGFIIHPILLSNHSAPIAPDDRKIKCCICTVA